MQAGERADREKMKDNGIRGIQCTVKNCQYHSGASDCTADFIHVGPHATYARTGAVCATFNPDEDRHQMIWT